jgi:hypothetical protein
VASNIVRSNSVLEDDSSNGGRDGGNLSALDAALGTADRPFVIDEDNDDNDNDDGNALDLHMPVQSMPFKAAA